MKKFTIIGCIIIRNIKKNNCLQTDYCYKEMFLGCTNLRAVTCLATDIGATGCTLNWLKDAGTAVTGEKTFTTPASTGWTDGISGIPEGWTRVNAQ